MYKEQNVLQGRSAHLVVSSVDKDFIHNLQETWHIRHIALHHSFAANIVCPHWLSNRFDASDVGIRAFQDMLMLRKLNVLGIFRLDTV
jgi:hypothetical protein